MIYYICWGLSSIIIWSRLKNILSRFELAFRPYFCSIDCDFGFLRFFSEFV